MKEPSKAFVPKQDMIDEIIKDLALAGQDADISKEEVAAQVEADIGKPDGELVSQLIGEACLPEDWKKDAVIVPDTIKGEDAQVLIDVAPDLMSAKIKITPPKAGGRAVSEDDILDALRQNRIIKGIKFDYVYRLAHHTVYGRTFKIAQGAAPTDGEDAKLVYQFEQTENPARLYSAEDYARVNSTTVKTGELLCEVAPATPARNGWNILGKLLPGKEGKSIEDAAGSGTMQFNSALYATCDGIVSMQNGKVSVYPAKTEREMDNRKTAFDGTVLVEGSVVNGSVIEAQGDIIVKGSVQNAKLLSKGNIIICKGVTGSSIVEAEGSLRSYFIEKAKVRVGQDITTDVVMRADISCGGCLRLAGKRRNLIGGHCRVGGSLYAGNIGNSANIPTEIFLMGKERIREEKQQALDRTAKCRDAIDKLIQTMQNAVEQNWSLEKRKKLAIDVTYAKKKLEKEIEAQNELLKALYIRECSAVSGEIVVTGRMYPNVSLNVDGVFYRNEKEQSYVTITKHHAKLLFSAGKGERR